MGTLEWGLSGRILYFPRWFFSSCLDGLYPRNLDVISFNSCSIAAISAFGGWGETVQAVGELNINHLSMVKGVGAIAIISSLAWGLGYFGQPHIIVRFMAMRSAKDVPVARFIGTTWM